MLLYHEIHIHLCRGHEMYTAISLVIYLHPTTPVTRPRLLHQPVLGTVTHPTSPCAQINREGSECLQGLSHAPADLVQVRNGILKVPSQDVRGTIALLHPFRLDRVLHRLLLEGMIPDEHRHANEMQRDVDRRTTKISSRFCDHPTPNLSIPSKRTKIHDHRLPRKWIS